MRLSPDTRKLYSPNASSLQELKASVAGYRQVLERISDYSHRDLSPLASLMRTDAEIGISLGDLSEPTSDALKMRFYQDLKRSYGSALEEIAGRAKSQKNIRGVALLMATWAVEALRVSDNGAAPAFEVLTDVENRGSTSLRL
jgi:hypothetical protein